MSLRTLALTPMLLAGSLLACSGEVHIGSTSSSSSSSGGSGGAACSISLPAGCACPSDIAAPWSRLADGTHSQDLATRGALSIAPDGSTVISVFGEGGVKLDGAGEVAWSTHHLASTPDAWAVDPRDCSTLVAGAISAGATDWLGRSLTCSGAHCPFVARVDATGSVVWVKVYDLAGGWVQPSIAGVTADGRIALFGPFETTIDLGNGPLEAPPVPSSGVFAALLSADGDSLWSRRLVIEQTGLERVSAVVSDAGDIAVTAQSIGAADFGDGPIPGPDAMSWPTLLLASFDSNGTLRFGKVMGYPQGGAEIFSVAQAATGNLIVAGTALGAMDFGGGPVGPSDQRLTTIASFDASGQHLWSKALGDGADRQPGLGIDSAGHIWVGTGSNTIVELDAAGAPLATHALSGSGKRHASAIGFAPLDGAPIIAGTFDAAIDLGQGPLVAQSKTDTFVARLAP